MHWGAALASITDPPQDFFSFFHILDETSLRLGDAFHFSFFLFLMIIRFPSHVYDLFVAVFVAILATATMNDCPRGIAIYACG